MASYFYLMSSLPGLRSDAELPITYAEFLECCQPNVSASTYQLLADLTLASDKGPLIEDWFRFYGMLSKELNYQRSQKLGKSYSGAYDKDGLIGQVVNSALKAKNPLEAEKILLAYEFEMLDTLVGLHAFDDYELFGYAIKLKLLERQECFEQEKGKAEFKALFDQVQQRVYSL